MFYQHAVLYSFHCTVYDSPIVWLSFQFDLIPDFLYTCEAGILWTNRLHAFIYMQHAEAALLWRLRWSPVIATLYSMSQSSVMFNGKWLGPGWCLALHFCQSLGCFNFPPCSVAYLLQMPYADVLFCVHGLLRFWGSHHFIARMGLQFRMGDPFLVTKSETWRWPVDVGQIPWNFMAKVMLKHFPQLELSKLRGLGGLDYTRFFLWHDIKILHFEVQYWLDWLKNDPNALSKSTSCYSLLVISCVVG